MGIFDKLLGKGAAYPSLDPASPAATRLSGLQGQLEPFVKQVSDKIEIVPLDQEAAVFIGKPPDAFGAAMVRDGKILNFKTLMQDKKLPPDQVQILSDKLREAYVRSKNAGRYSAAVAGKPIVVTASDSLARDVAGIFRELSL
jgi:hypothetical protein